MILDRVRFPSNSPAALACLAVLAAAPGPAQQTDAVEVTSDPQTRDATYTAADGACRVRWILSASEINRGVIRHHSRCSLPLAGQMPLIARVMGKVFEEYQGADAPRTLFWGRLYPDGQQDATLAMRLAVAARHSKLWNAALGRPRGGNANDAVRQIANEALIYEELRDVFRARGLDIRVASVEKVLVAPAGQLPFYRRLPQDEIKAADKLPYDCMTWFSITKLRP
jgi:hypothetical protein